MSKAIKTFEVVEAWNRGGWFKISVSFNGRVVDTFSKRTWIEARQAFYKAGYQRIAWAEGRRIVCEEEDSAAMPALDVPK